MTTACQRQHKSAIALARCMYPRADIDGNGFYGVLYDRDTIPDFLWLFRTEEEARFEYRVGSGSRRLVRLPQDGRPHGSHARTRSAWELRAARGIL